MTLQQLYYCIAIAENGSMNKAAEKLFISQPTLTTAIRELENEIGIQIFLRTSKGVYLTNEGQEFLIYARQVYQQYELLNQKYSVKGNIKRKFSVSCQHYSFAIKAFVEMVKQYDTLNYEFAIRETKTYDVIKDVGTMKSEIGILYLSDFNEKYINKLLKDNELDFTPICECDAYVYLWKKHPLASKKSITLNDLFDYPCLSFDQGEQGSLFLAEEILSDIEYPRVIKASDRATMLNLMIGLNGFTLCSGIICEELNNDDCLVVPFKEDEHHQNSTMRIGYITKKRAQLSEIGTLYINEIFKYVENR